MKKPKISHSRNLSTLKKANYTVWNHNRYIISKTHIQTFICNHKYRELSTKNLTLLLSIIKGLWSGTYVMVVPQACTSGLPSADISGNAQVPVLQPICYTFSTLRIYLNLLLTTLPIYIKRIVIVTMAF